MLSTLLFFFYCVICFWMLVVDIENNDDDDGESDAQTSRWAININKTKERETNKQYCCNIEKDVPNDKQYFNRNKKAFNDGEFINTVGLQ